MTIMVHLIRWKGGTDIQAFDKGPAVHVSLAVIYMTEGRQGESLYGWAETADFKRYPSATLLREKEKAYWWAVLQALASSMKELS